jgi:hypothetical protein
MNEHDHEEAKHGRFAVPGPESHETDQALSPDELGDDDQPVPPASEPKQPSASPLAHPPRGKAGFWARITKRLNPRS